MLLPVNKGGFSQIRDKDGQIIISDTTLQKLLPTLRKLLPNELRPATETHKQLCGCELCNTATSLHKTLSAFCSRTLKQMRERVNWAVLPRQRLTSLRLSQDYSHLVANPDRILKHSKPSDALTTMTYEDIADTEFPPWTCVLGTALNVPSTKSPGLKTMCSTMPLGSTS
jgi:hypothetical protein